MSAVVDGTGKLVVQGGAIVISGALQITTPSLANATVGTAYTASLAATGGTPPYTWNVVTDAPNDHLWGSLLGNGQYVGTPQDNEVKTLTIQVNDSVGATAQKTFTLTSAATGALSVVTPSLPAGKVAVPYFTDVQAQGGTPPYSWTVSGTPTGTAGLYITVDGWVTGYSAVSETDSITVVCTDATGATANKALSVALTGTGPAILGLDSFGYVRVPAAYASTLYRHQLQASGGTSPYTWAITSGSLPTGLSLSAGGLITGTLGAIAGNSSSCSVRVTDNASNTSTQTIYMPVVSLNKVTRPVYNTGTGYFVHSDGTFRNPDGTLFILRGTNRTHYDSGSGPVQAKAQVNSCRWWMYLTQFQGSNPVGSQTAATYFADALADNTNNKIFGIVTLSSIPGVNGTGGRGTAGNASVADLGTCAAWWATSYAAWHASGLEGKAGLNVANEWVGNSTASQWQNLHVAVQSTVSNISGTTITLSTVSGSHPLANNSGLGWAFLSGSTGNSNQIVTVTATGGSSGAWTVTTGTTLVASSNGTLWSGVIGMIRGAGYVDPIVIDAAGQAESYLTGGALAAIQASDPQKNVIGTYHQYGASCTNFQNPISSITTGATTTITLNNSAATHPWKTQPSNWTGVTHDPWYASTYTLWQPSNQINISGVTGLTPPINGGPYTVNAMGGVSGAWTIVIALNTTGTTGTASGGTAQDYIHYMVQSARLQTVQTGQNCCAQVQEFGLPYNQDGGSLTAVGYGQAIAGFESYGLSWVYWSIDDNNLAGSQTSNWFYGSQKTNGTYSTPADLTPQGLDILLNPRYGVLALSQYSTGFLP